MARQQVNVSRTHTLTSSLLEMIKASASNPIAAIRTVLGNSTQCVTLGRGKMVPADEGPQLLSCASPRGLHYARNSQFAVRIGCARLPAITPLSNALLGTAATSISGYPMRKLESLFLYQRAIAETPSVRLPRVLAAVITDCLTMRYLQTGARSTLTRLQQAK